MVCPRCLRVVREELEKLGHHILEIRLGEVVLQNEPSDLSLISKALESHTHQVLQTKAGLLKMVF